MNSPSSDDLTDRPSFSLYSHKPNSDVGVKSRRFCLVLNTPTLRGMAFFPYARIILDRTGIPVIG